jgi:hypothetical protein
MPDTLVSGDVVTAAVRLACRAPSLHNSQPWRWVVNGAGLDLFVDPGRKVVSTDHSGREALISCGAVLDHTRVAMAAGGWNTNVDRFPNPNDLNHLASLDFSPAGFVTDGQRARADAILRRRTDRLPFAAPPNWETFEPELRGVVTDSGVHLDILSDAVRPQLAEASRLSEILRLYDSSYHAELSWWTGEFEGSDGIPRSALASATESERVDIGRDFPVGAASERRPEIARDRSTVLVLSTDDDTRGDAVRCGEVLSAVLLECTVAGLATCTLSHITELAAGRGVIGALVGGAVFPQLLIRVGEVPALGEIAPATPRRALDDVLVWRVEPEHWTTTDSAP